MVKNNCVGQYGRIRAVEKSYSLFDCDAARALAMVSAGSGKVSSPIPLLRR